MDPTWNPTTEAELAAAAANGLLIEDHHLDIKRELAAGKGANEEVARDMASFAVDGGLLLLGVEFDAIGLHNSMMRPDMAHGHSGAPGAEVQSQGPTATSTPR